jgi:hypothetical protein
MIMMEYSTLDFLGYFRDVEIRVILNPKNQILVKSRRCIHRTKKEDLCYDCQKLIEENRSEYDKVIEGLKSTPREILDHRLRV